jgi:hypothetical protein
MTIIMLLWWSLGRGNPAVPSRWQATIEARHTIGLIGHADNAKSDPCVSAVHDAALYS